jgi:serine carboxypeptidase-like clade 2
LAVLIDFYNNQGVGKKVNLKGILVGNGVMSFENGELEKSQIDYMISREFIDPDILPYYRSSCIIDPQSAGCRYFNTKYGENVDEINPYSKFKFT